MLPNPPKIATCSCPPSLRFRFPPLPNMKTLWSSLLLCLSILLPSGTPNTFNYCFFLPLSLSLSLSIYIYIYISVYDDVIHDMIWFCRSNASGSEPTPETTPMTIFYNGSVTVFDVPRHKVRQYSFLPSCTLILYSLFSSFINFEVV
ncbi:hypothetical protein CsSME_00021556 [Camellia sinensis var. sinensis]